MILATTIPKSLDVALREHAKATGRPRSEHLAAALRAYLHKTARRSGGRKPNHKTATTLKTGRR